MKKQKVVLVTWLAVFLWMLLIFHLSSQVAEQSNQLSKGVTKVVVEAVEKVAPGANFDFSRLNHIIRKHAHFFAYLVLGVLTTNAIRYREVTTFKAVRLSLLICVLYAVSDEVHQLFVSGRGAQVTDVLLDSAGALVGIGMYGFCKHILIRGRDNASTKGSNTSGRARD